MYYKIIRYDILKSKVITATTMAFVTAAAILVSLAAVLLVNLTGAIDTLMSQAKTPHYLQMHSGTIDFLRLDNFARENSNVEEFQVLEFLNIDGAEFVINNKSLADSVQDNGLCFQSEKFDYLLDLKGKVIKVHEGEIYVPVSYFKDRTAAVGDKVIVGHQEFRIAGFLRDSQMNSLLASSKRFLIHKNDFISMKNLGNTEYLIEFRLKDLSGLSTFESAYTVAGLEANGPAVTLPLFKMLNAISDGLMIGVILFVSILVVMIAFLCIRFTLLAKIEDDYREIGVLKAIGMRVLDIKKIYLAKYAVIAAVSCILGYGISFLFRGVLLKNIRLYMGESENVYADSIFAILGIVMVFLAMISYVNSVLGRFHKISAAKAINYGAVEEKSAVTKHFLLSKNKFLSTNLFLGIKDVLIRKRVYATMLAVIIISVFIINVPSNLYNTISKEGFITYLGIGKCDIRIDIQQTDYILQKTEEIKKTLERDDEISKYVVLTTKTLEVKTQDASVQRIKIELGDHTVFPVEYSEGKAPVTEEEIALSVMNAEELGKKTGDILTLVNDGQEKALTVCGIYSDITNGGKTAKAVFTEDTADTMWSVISIQLNDKTRIEEKISNYIKQFPYAKTAGITEYISQTFDNTINAVKTASLASFAVAMLITFLITILFLKMLMAKDKYSIAAMKALGFTNSDIKAQYVTRSVFVLLIGVILGTLLSGTLGEVLAGTLMQSFGASSFRFEINLFSTYLFCPLMMIGLVLIATIAATSGTEQIKIAEHIKE